MVSTPNRTATIRVLLALALFAAPFTLFVADYVARLRFDALVAEIERVGGRATYLREDSETVERMWDILRGRDPQVERIYVLNLAGCNISDEWMKKLLRLRRVKSLTLNGTPVTDAGIAHISHMATMEMLSLRGTAVTDQGLLHLSRMENLEVLDLSGTQIVGWGLRHLCDNRTLWSICLHDVPTLDSAQLDGLACIPSLSHLDLTGPQIDDRAMEHVARMPALEELDISETNVGNAGIAALEPLAGRLDRLWLFGTQLTDEATEALARLQPRLVVVPLGVSNEAIEELRRRMPNSVIGSEAEYRTLVAQRQQTTAPLPE